MKTMAVIIHPHNCLESTLVYGGKCVGTFIGTDEYIRKKLDEKLESLKKLKNSILKIKNKQITNQILRLSFSGMVNHFQRTTPNHILRDFLIGFDNLKKGNFL